jgi:hypothetical protein
MRRKPRRRPPYRRQTGNTKYVVTILECCEPARFVAVARDQERYFVEDLSEATVFDNKPEAMLESVLHKQHGRRVQVTSVERARSYASRTQRYKELKDAAT